MEQEITMAVSLAPVILKGGSTRYGDTSGTLNLCGQRRDP
jgi:hypothetical protein